jgi:hypothetical protein
MKATAKKMVAVFKGDTYEVISKMRSGTPARTVPAIAANLGLSPDTLFDLLRLPESTLKGRISSGGKLSAPEQDRMYRTCTARESTLSALNRSLTQTLVVPGLPP